MICIEAEGESFILSAEDIQVKRVPHAGLIALTEESLTVSLNTNLTEDLIVEADARELVNKINTMRKSENFEIIDRIDIKIDATPKVKKAFIEHQEMICQEVLALSVDFGPCEGALIDINGESVTLALTKR